MILIVDDDPTTADLLARFLRRAGYDSSTVTCGEELFRSLEHSRPTLIVLDMAMPGISGIDCLNKLSAHPKWREIPVVAYSADHTLRRQQQAMRAGARDYVVKGTIGWNDLIRVVQKYLDIAPETSAVPHPTDEPATQ